MTDYDFRNLSPIDFEALIRDLIGAEEGIILETFVAGPDGGIDCRFQSEERLVVVQCKHRPGATKPQIKKSVQSDMSSLRLDESASEFNSVNEVEYHFVTSADLSPGATVEIESMIRESFPMEVKVWARGGLNALLSRHKRIERQHFKLWLNSAQALESIIGASEWRRNESLIHDIQTKVSIYVDTPEYAEAIERLSDENIVIISGAPGVGKSTLAEMLLLTYWEAGWKVVDLVDDISDAWSHIVDDSGERVIFYYDDFLGQTSSIELQKNESGELGRVVSAINRSVSGNYKLVMTTREQILNTALSGPDDRIRNSVSWINKIRIDLTELSRNVKAKMLFNHLYFGYGSSAIREELSRDSRYFRVIDHSGFNPRILESVILVKKPNSVESLYGDLIQALDRPDEIWLGSFNQLSELAVRILLHLTVRPERAVEVSQIKMAFVNSNPRDFTNALRVLEDTWIKIDKSRSSTMIRFYDPSRKDFLLGILDDILMLRQTICDTDSMDQIEFILKSLGRSGLEALPAEIRKLVEVHSLNILKMRISEEEEYVPVSAELIGRSQNYASVASVLSSCCKVVFKLSPATALKESLEEATRRLEDDWPWRRIPDSSDLFDLADSLVELPDDWALKRAMT